MMNKIKFFVLFTFTLLLTWNASAQNSGQRGPRGEQRPDFEQLKKALELSDDQSAALKPVFEDTKAKMEALRTKEFDTREDRREAMKAIMEAQRTQLESILNEEQLEKLKELHMERGPRGQRGPRGKQGASANKEQRQALHEELKAYHTENILPEAKKQRAKLEEFISAEDKATLAEFRAQRAEMHEHRKETRENSERQGPPSEEQRAARKQHMDTMKALVEKYDAQMEPLLAELKKNGEEWHNDLKTIHEKYRPEGSEKMGEGQTRKRGQARKGRKGQGKEGLHKHEGEGRPLFRKAQFLMLDPNSDDASGFIEESPFEMEAFPNPARSMANINFKVTQAGNVSIVLRNKAGNINRVLFSGYKQAGDHNLQVNVGGLQPGNYFYTITDASGSKPVTKQLVVTQ